MEVTIEITQYCPWECDYCSSMAGPTGQHLDLETILTFLKKQKDITRINISGGEPISHPQFYEILMYCYTLTDNVWVYTNALTNIIFNASIRKEVTVEANVCVITGRYINIPEKANKIHLLKLTHQGRAKDFPSQNIVVSRNFWDPEHCDDCNHTLLQADGKVVTAPCKKDY